MSSANRFFYKLFLYRRYNRYRRLVRTLEKKTDPVIKGLFCERARKVIEQREKLLQIKRVGEPQRGTDIFWSRFSKTGKPFRGRSSGKSVPRNSAQECEWYMNNRQKPKLLYRRAVILVTKYETYTPIISKTELKCSSVHGFALLLLSTITSFMEGPSRNGFILSIIFAVFRETIRFTPKKPNRKEGRTDWKTGDSLRLTRNMRRTRWLGPSIYWK